MKIKGKVVETLIIEKEVEIEVPDGTDPIDARDEIRNKAYEKTIFLGDHGWEGVDTLDVNVMLEHEYMAV